MKLYQYITEINITILYYFMDRIYFIPIFITELYKQNKGTFFFGKKKFCITI